MAFSQILARILRGFSEHAERTFRTPDRLHCGENSGKPECGVASRTGLRLFQNLFAEDITMFRNRVSKRNLLLISVGLLILTAMSIILAPKRARAEEGIPIRGIFTVAYSGTPNTAGVSFCGGRHLDIAVEAHGAGSSTLGALSFSLEKTLEATGPSCMAVSP
jgi:hypothetical protein